MENSLLSIINVLPEEVINPYEVMGSVVMAAHPLQHPTMGEIFIDIQSCALRIWGLGLDPMVDDQLALTLSTSTRAHQNTWGRVSQPKELGYEIYLSGSCEDV